ncbi:MAG: amino acid ABC transporter permease [Clostridia bacterium]|nr:amino acid ABC transporter permease [Clostridia bacterium]
MNWELIVRYLPYLLEGAVLTVQLTVMGVAFGSVLGVILGLARVSPFRFLRWLAIGYIDFFRGTPLLVQIFLIHMGLPQLGIDLGSAINSAIIALTLNSGAYIGEIFRAGIQSIDRGQMEAARSLGMSYLQSMRHIILPQAFKRVIPPLGNEFITLLKDSSLVSVISAEELMMKANVMQGTTYRPFEAYLTAAAIYLILTLTISQLVAYAERRLKTGDSH